MNYKMIALASDAQVKPLQAAWAYEIAINETDSDLELFLNLAVLYFVCVDYGYASFHNLSEDFVTAAFDRALEIIDKAEERFGNHTELRFWRLYFSYIYSDESINQSIEDLILEGDSLMPYIYLYTSSGKKKYAEEMQKLLDLVKDASTERKRYVLSIIEK